MPQLEINVKRLLISTNIDRLVVSDSVGFWGAKINLDKEWDGLNKKIVFYTDTAAVDVLIPDDNIVQVPFEVLTANAELRFTISGYNSTTKIHTKEMMSSVRVCAAGKNTGDDSEAYTPELWEQVMASLPGDSAYEIAVKNGFEGSEEEWLKSLEGAAGPQGNKGDKGASGKDAVTDPSYNPTSENAQSGKAVAEAVETHNTGTEAHADIRNNIHNMNVDMSAISNALSNQYDQIQTLQETALTEEFATRYDNINLAVSGVFEFKPNSLYFCTGNGKNLTLRKWNGTAYESLVTNSPTIICICSKVQTTAEGAKKWQALFVYQTEKSYGLITLPNMVIDSTTIVPEPYKNTLTLTHTGNASTTDAYIFYQHTGE